jgi:hypothetical protein
MKSMLQIFKITILFVLIFTTIGCAQISEMARELGGELPLTEQEVVNGLLNALEVGAVRAATDASSVGGYLNNELLFIAFPPEARRAANTLRDIGLGSLVDDFVRTLNRSAEEAAKQAAPIFTSAIQQMTIRDAFDILNGPNDAATEYLRRTTSNQLAAAFRPVIVQALETTEATRYWSDITSQYNQIPFVTPVRTDLAEYTTEHALKGLFTLLADEEQAIRENPAKRTTEILRRVFGHSSVERG